MLVLLGINVIHFAHVNIVKGLVLSECLHVQTFSNEIPEIDELQIGQ